MESAKDVSEGLARREAMDSALTGVASFACQRVLEKPKLETSLSMVFMPIKKPYCNVARGRSDKLCSRETLL